MLKEKAGKEREAQGTKGLFFLGSSQDDLRSFPADARKALGHNLDLVQNNLTPEDWKPMSEIGAGVMELRVHTPGAFRVFYIAKFPEAVYVLHAFSKKTRQISQQDKKIGRARYRALMQFRQDQSTL